MRFLSLAAGLITLALAAPASAQDAPAPHPQSTFVAPTHAGEAVRVTTYEQRPSEQGRLARRYKGIRANRSVPTETAPIARIQPAARTYSTPRTSFIQRGGTFFQILPRR